MSEEATMYEELQAWSRVIRKLQALASEMESREQDGDYITQQIRKLFTDYSAFEPDENGVSDSYKIDFENPDQKFWNLVFEFKVYFERKTP